MHGEWERNATKTLLRKSLLSLRAEHSRDEYVLFSTEMVSKNWMFGILIAVFIRVSKTYMSPKRQHGSVSNGNASAYI